MLFVVNSPPFAIFSSFSAGPKSKNWLFSPQNNRGRKWKPNGRTKMRCFKGLQPGTSPVDNYQLLKLQDQGFVCLEVCKIRGRDEACCCRGTQEDEGLFQGTGQIHWTQVANGLQEDRPLKGDIQSFWQGQGSFEVDEIISDNVRVVESDEILGASTSKLGSVNMKFDIFLSGNGSTKVSDEWPYRTESKSWLTSCH